MGSTVFKIEVGDCLGALRRMPDASVDAVVTDPPYGLGREPDPREVLRAWLDGAEYKPGGTGFMGKAWDAFVPSPLVWAECHRVLKPGGHLLAFAGSRTYDWIALGARLAGFEVRDQIMWLYGSGFPKSHDVSKAIDRQRDDRAEVYRVTAWIRETRDAAGVTNRQIDAAFGCNGMARHWTDVPPNGKQPSVPTLEQIPDLLAVLAVSLDDVPDEIRELIWTLNGRKGQPGAAWFKRQSTGTSADRGGFAGVRLGASGNPSRDIPATEAAQRWDGWGTTLKPAHEPIVMARKPLAGTVAHNVTTHGTGAINVNGCRVGDDAGRWPANIMHDGSPEVLAGFPGDESRFFYTAKASRAERERGLTHTKGERRNIHPTVKPAAVMRWLVRLVTPPAGTVLDPYAGSGTTGVACALEGFDFIGCELSPEYAEIARARIEHARTYPSQWEPDADAPDEPNEDQLDMFQ
jgi:DNA modification methylase